MQDDPLMPLYKIVKADGTREKVEAEYTQLDSGALHLCRTRQVVDHDGYKDREQVLIVAYSPNQWLEVWRREGVGE